MNWDGFHPVTAAWFQRRFGEPTEPQAMGWPVIQAGRDVLIAAPTGSGKTLAAFLACLDALLQQAIAGRLADEVQVLYLSPLKALSNDIRRNLEGPLAELLEEARASGYDLPPIRAGLRTGDTPARERLAMVKRPPHILVTTPESFFLLLTSEKGRESLRSVRTVIVDEIHALARDKRGSHLSLSLERLEALTGKPPVRIGLSATQRPIDQIAGFLVGAGRLDDQGRPKCDVLDVGHRRDLDLAVLVPPSELGAVCTHEIWGEIYQKLLELIGSHRSTLIFVNTRRLAERVAHHLRERLGNDQVAGHHGSMSREARLDVEERLKSGALRAIVATASLEMGIDVGFIDLVCQISSPRAIATFLQRVGRAGHSLGLVPKGRLFPLTRDDLLESAALVRAVGRGGLDAIEIPPHPVDILAQQIVAATCIEEWNEEELFRVFRRAWPYRNLSRDLFEQTLGMLSERAYRGNGSGVRLHRDRLHGRIKATRGARIAVATCGGAIPDTADYRVVTDEEGTFVGTVNEDFAIESQRGDIFLLGNASWRVRYLRGSELIVTDAHAAPATIPFWLGEAPGRTIELSAEISGLREDLAERIDVEDSETLEPARLAAAEELLRRDCGLDEWGARQAARYVAAQKAALGVVPTQRRIVFERFFDDTGGMQLVVHAPYGARINRAWGLAMRKRFCRSFDFELQAAADNNGFVLSLGPQHSFPVDSLFGMLRADNGEHFLTQALLAAPMFKVRWRWNASRSLSILRSRGGQRVPPALLRFRSDDFLTAVFPAQTACLENRPEDLEIPDHPLVRQTVDDCLHEAMDLERWLALLRGREAGEIEFVPKDTREPSPFSHELLNANPYAFLDDAPLEERRARAVATRRTLAGAALEDLGKLDADAIEQVRRDAWPSPRDPDELHDVLVQMIALPAMEGAGWVDLFERLRSAGRAVVVQLAEGGALWASAEHQPSLRAVYPDATFHPEASLPPQLTTPADPLVTIREMVRGRMDAVGPTTVAALARALHLPSSTIEAALEGLEGEGTVLRGRFTPGIAADAVEWCQRRLLVRVHRRTLDAARRQVKPVEIADYVAFLARHQHVMEGTRLEGPEGLRAIIGQLAGFETPAGAWEYDLFSDRLVDYDPSWLDEWTMTGEACWGRLQPPRAPSERTSRGTLLTRVVPIAIFPRADLPWLLPPAEARESERKAAAGDALTVLETLASRGAVFLQDLAAATGLLPAQLDEALSELAALGFVTADGFAGIRAIVGPDHRPLVFRGIGRGRRTPPRRQPRGGRWALFPGPLAPVDPAQRIERWANQLLARYGVVFRDLLARESVAPPWREIAACCRRLEARGVLRGGRFIAVPGEQFALPGVVEELRKVRDTRANDEEVVVSAADPLNLAGILGGGPRVPAVRGNAVFYRGGKPAASLQAGRMELHEKLDAPAAERVRKLLTRTAAVRRHEEKLVLFPEA